MFYITNKVVKFQSSKVSRTYLTFQATFTLVHKSKWVPKKLHGLENILAACVASVPKKSVTENKVKYVKECLGPRRLDKVQRVLVEMTKKKLLQALKTTSEL